ncbi:MAG: Gx transporter family protein [Ruminococcaceae bacterium]|nr:Gx transporter family protein [Oscillospiraceae bacterium]
MRRISVWAKDRFVKQVLYCAMYTALALMLSFVEVLLPLTAAIPLPGFKLGLANLAVMDCAFRLGLPAAFAVSLARVLLMGILFGNVTSFFFSLCGGITVLLILTLCKRLGSTFSFVGISVLCAMGHSAGQLFCAVCIMGSGMALLTTYAPFLAAASLLFGFVNGLLLFRISPRLPLLSEKHSRI